jgi:hypothetical protein
MRWHTQGESAKTTLALTPGECQRGAPCRRFRFGIAASERRGIARPCLDGERARPAASVASRFSAGRAREEEGRASKARSREDAKLTGWAALSRRPTPTLDAQVLNRLRVQRTQLSLGERRSRASLP